MKNNSGSGWIVVAVLVLILVVLFSGHDDSNYRNTLESGLNKYYSGQSMTKGEYNAVKGFNDWKANQGSKTYSQWG